MVEHLGSLLFIVCVVLLLLALLSRSGSNEQLEKSTRRENGSLSLNAAAAPRGASTITLWVRIGVTSLLLTAALDIILSQHYQADEQKWAFGVVGTIIGYWLKG